MKKKSKVVIILLFVSLVVLIFAIGALALNSSNKKKEAQLLAQQAAEELAAQQELLAQQEAEEEEEPPVIEVTIEDSVDEDDADSYTYEDMDVTMYCVEDNTRLVTLPNQKGELIGTYKQNKALSVVAQCVETGYYKVKANGSYGYVEEDALSEEYASIPLPISGTVTVPTATKDILFIGNSITCYPATDYWWGNSYGMGASTVSNDYVHLTVSAMGYSSYDAMSMRAWEFSTTRNNELTELDHYICNYAYRIIVIELGENAKGQEAHLKEDFLDMIKYIRTFNPNAKIVMMDNFWKYDGVISIKKAVASEAGLTYVSLSDCWGVKDYQLQAGEQYTGPDGTVYTVNDFIAGHPNDAGFAVMASHLISALQGL